MRTTTLPVLLLGLAALPACRPAPAPAPPAAAKAAPDATLDPLLKGMRSRLEVMHDVARWKWTAKAAFEDPVREASLLKDLAARGVALKLDPRATRAFFRAQIEAAKLVQRDDFRRWQAEHHAPDGKAPDLATVLRPRIDALNRDMLDALSRALPRLHGDQTAPTRINSRAEELLAGEGISADVRSTAIAPLIRACAGTASLSDER